MVTRRILGREMTGRLYLEKRGIRGFTVAESFDHDSTTSVLSGVVMRGDLLLDGVVVGYTTVGGDDATDVILSMFQRLQRSDISYLLVSGMVMSLYNVVNLKRLYELLCIPVIGISYRDSDGIGSILRDRFSQSRKSKLAAYGNLGPREKIHLHTFAELFVRRYGCSVADVTRLLDGLTLQGSIPEPVRVARLLSRAIRCGTSPPMQSFHHPH